MSAQPQDLWIDLDRIDALGSFVDRDGDIVPCSRAEDEDVAELAAEELVGEVITGADETEHSTGRRQLALQRHGLLRHGSVREDVECVELLRNDGDRVIGAVVLRAIVPPDQNEKHGAGRDEDQQRAK